MRIQLRRTGGFTGIPLNVNLETDQIEEEEQNDLLALVDEAQFFSLPEKIPPASPQPDRFQYRITIDRAGHSHTVEAGESSMPDALRRLSARIIALGGAPRK